MGSKSKSFDEKASGAVLVTGSSGLVGRYFVKRLSTIRPTTVALYHHRLPEPMPNVFPVCSDMSSSELLLAPLRGIDTVIHLAWEGTYMGPSVAGIKMAGAEHRLSGNTRLTQNLVEAVEKSGVKRLIFLSAIGASRGSSSSFLREKYESELAILNARVKEKLVVRSSIIYGEGGPSDKFTHAIQQLMRAPMFYPIPEHRIHIAPIHVKDMVEVLCKLVDMNIQDRANLLEVTGSEVLKVEDVFRVAAKRLKTHKKLAVKGFLADQLSRILERESAKTGKLPAVSDILRSQLAPDEQLRQNNALMSQLPVPNHKIAEAFPNASTQLVR